ncbi:hypothetical protein CAXC1_350013 [Candidatus Xenohaliotis californiensis]|uniref:Uncharacterized protein n=1 Tax=Candidatus Xenohaliotis californiensis TaxID=84677 RepID=A0ABP0EWF9_9RICK|nr:hypothetical protein CAXC1_350013 [Candidatus Xenohaliotis californiensis]
MEEELIEKLVDSLIKIKKFKNYTIFIPHECFLRIIQQFSIIFPEKANGKPEKQLESIQFAKVFIARDDYFIDLYKKFIIAIFLLNWANKLCCHETNLNLQILPKEILLTSSQDISSLSVERPYAEHSVSCNKHTVKINKFDENFIKECINNNTNNQIKLKLEDGVYCTATGVGIVMATFKTENQAPGQTFNKKLTAAYEIRSSNREPAFTHFEVLPTKQDHCSTVDMGKEGTLEDQELEAKSSSKKPSFTHFEVLPTKQDHCSTVDMGKEGTLEDQELEAKSSSKKPSFTHFEVLPTKENSAIWNIKRTAETAGEKLKQSIAKTCSKVKELLASTLKPKRTATKKQPCDKNHKSTNKLYTEESTDSSIEDTLNTTKDLSLESYVDGESYTEEDNFCENLNSSKQDKANHSTCQTNEYIARDIKHTAVATKDKKTTIELKDCEYKTLWLYFKQIVIFILYKIFLFIHIGSIYHKLVEIFHTIKNDSSVESDHDKIKNEPSTTQKQNSKTANNSQALDADKTKPQTTMNNTEQDQHRPMVENSEYLERSIKEMISELGMI